MFFRNLFLYRIPTDVLPELARMESAMADHRLRHCGSMELGTRGFIAPVGRGEDAALTHDVSGCVLLTLGTEDKLLPAAVVNDELARRVQKIVEEEDRKVGGRERKRLKEDVLNELVPRAFIRTGGTSAYADSIGQWLVINTSSRKAGEALVTAIREALGSFPVLPLSPTEGPRVLMTDWLATGDLPAGLTLGDECELRDPATKTGAVSRNTRQDLDSEEIKEHLRNGKQVYKLGLVFDERMSFVLSEDLSISKLRFLDVVLEELGDDHADSAALADAQFALMALELRRFLKHFESWFGLTLDAPLHLHRQEPPLGMRMAEETARRASQRLDSLAREHGTTITLEHQGQVLATFGDADDELLPKAIEYVRAEKRASISGIQRQFRIGYNRAARVIEEMERQGVISAPEHNGMRHVLPGNVVRTKTSPS